MADIIGSVLVMPVKPKSIDTVLATEVLEHLAEPSVTNE